MTPWSPALAPLSQWLSPADPSTSGGDDALAERDRQLGEDRAVLCSAEELLASIVLRHRPEATGPAAAVDLDVLAARLSEPAREDRALLQRASVLCAGEDWDRLAAVLPSLRTRVVLVTEAIADLAVTAARQGRTSRSHLAVVPTPDEAAFAAEAAAVDDELRRRTARAGADSAWAAADGALLPSLSDFLV
jgi:hypothetical protein